MTANPHRINHQYSKRHKCWFIALSTSSILSWQSSDDCGLLLILLIIQFVQAAIRSRVRESATRVARPDAHKSSLRVSRVNSSLKMPYSAGVHPIAIGKPVQKIGLPYNNSLYPNWPLPNAKVSNEEMDVGFDYERAYLYHQSDGHTVAACFSWLNTAWNHHRNAMMPSTALHFWRRWPNRIDWLSLAPLFLDTERAEALEIGLTDASEGQASKFWTNFRLLWKETNWNKLFHEVSACFNGNSGALFTFTHTLIFFQKCFYFGFIVIFISRSADNLPGRDMMSIRISQCFCQFFIYG